uniref:Uncharacterized protein n=1 Tax=Arundo donax TaxID=35708 RepID=A0A0A9A4P6_ARUDO
MGWGRYILNSFLYCNKKYARRSVSFGLGHVLYLECPAFVEIGKLVGSVMMSTRLIYS